ncbi:MAG: SRPBCC family protein [Actinobacteria bacterium]|nr:SRPBCC family protein [Actinomycetota bacterium]
MQQVRNSQHVDAPPEVVWPFVWNAELRPQWEAGVLEVKGVHGPLDEVGGRWTEVRKGPAKQTFSSEVMVKAVEPFKLWEVTGSMPAGPGSLHHVVRHTLEPENGGTRKVVTSTFELHGFMSPIVERFILKPLIQRHSNKCEANLARLAEEAARTEAVRR